MVILEALKQFKTPTDLAVFFYKNNPLEWWASIRFKDGYFCPKCGKQYVSIQGKLIEENTYSNSVVSACFNLWERRTEFRKNNPNTRFESHLNPAKGLKRLGIYNIDTETFYNISKRFENWDYSENNPTEVMIDEYYLHNNPRKAKGKNRLQQYRQNISCLVIVDQYKNTLMIPYEEKNYNNNIAFAKLLQRYIGNNSIIVTDESNLYKLAGSTFVKRYNSNHTNKIFTTVVDGKTYSSNICENNVRYMKRCIVGNYNRLSVKYCDLYLAGRSFRSNNNFKATNNAGRVKAYFDLVDFDTQITIKGLQFRNVA